MKSFLKRDFIVILAFLLVIVFIISGTKIQSPEEYYLEHLDDIKEDSETVFLTVRCDSIFDNYEKLDEGLKSEKYLPKDGMIIPRKELVLRAGDSVYSVLDRALRSLKIRCESEYSQTYSGRYIKSIGHIYEFSCGELSGWMFSVNGEKVLMPCDKVKLRDGDEIVFFYTCDLGRDFDLSGGEAAS